MQEIWQHIGKVPNFPKEGMTFFDISPILQDAKLWKMCIDRLKENVMVFRPDCLVAVESRGFLFASAIAYSLDLGFIMVRKPGKLPGETVQHFYDLEYGKDCLEIQKDRLKKGQRAVIIDDIAATGGTLQATAHLLTQEGIRPEGIVCLLELAWLNPRATIHATHDIPLHSLLTIDASHAPI